MRPEKFSRRWQQTPRGCSPVIKTQMHPQWPWKAVAEIDVSSLCSERPEYIPGLEPVRPGPFLRCRRVRRTGTERRSDCRLTDPVVSRGDMDAAMRRVNAVAIEQFKRLVLNQRLAT